jgi:iron complex outermembrane receptor protein
LYLTRDVMVTRLLAAYDISLLACSGILGAISPMLVRLKNNENKRDGSRMIMKVFMQYVVAGLFFGVFSAPSLAAAAPRVIEEVLVTARKKAESLQDVPLSVSSFDRDFIGDAGIVDIGELVQYTPNVKFSDTSGHLPVLTIRGFGTPPSGRGIEPSVGLVIDDIFYGRITYINDTAFDIERLEVLRGPQGSLFGKNTIAGVMNFTTRDPDFEKSAFINLGYSSFNDVRAEAGLSFTVIEDVLAGRIAVRFRDRESWVYNTKRDEQHEQEDFGARIKLKWLVSDTMDVLLNVWTSKQKQVGLPLQLKEATANSLSVFRDNDPRVEVDEFDGNTSMDRESFSERETDSMNLVVVKDFTAPWIFTDLEMTILMGWSELTSPFAVDADFSPINFVDYGSMPGSPERYEQSQFELRFTGGLSAPFGWGEGIDFISGIFVDETENFVAVLQESDGEGIVEYYRAGAFLGAPLVPVMLPSFPSLIPEAAGGGRESINVYTDVETQSFAIFTQFDWRLTEKFIATLGLRYGESERAGQIVSSRSATTVITPLTTGQENFEENLEAKDYDFSPKVTLSWLPTTDSMFFATISKGFKSGGFAAGVFNDDNLTFEPEEATSYEIGAKVKLLGGSLMLNATAFRTDYENLQVRNYDGRTLSVSNAADAKTQGLELDFFWLTPLHILSLGGSFGFVDTEYLDYLCAPAPAYAAGGSGDPSCQDQSNVNNTTGVGQPAYQDLSGEPLAFAPDMSASLMANVTVPLWRSGVDLLMAVDVIYQGGHFLDTDNDPASHQEATTKFNARIGLKSIDGWSLIMNAKNITEEQESVLVIDQPLLPGNYVSAALPDEMMWTLSFRYDYQ